MKRKLFLGLIAFAAWGSYMLLAQPRSLIQSSVLTFSTNIPYDDGGKPDDRPTTWGSAGYRDVDIPFVQIPAGKRVRILRVYGDEYAFPHGRVPPGTHSGVMLALATKSTALALATAQSPYVASGLGAGGCFLWVCHSTGGESIRIPLDIDVSAGGLLDPDGILVVRQAVFLNDTGVPIHMEFTGIVQFRYE